MSPRKKFILALPTSLLAALVLFYFYYRKELEESPSYQLKMLAFTSIGKESIPKDFFEEVLDLNREPIHLLQFSTSDGRNKLLDYPFIEDATVESLPPDTLFVACKLRQPCFELADFENLSVDKHGVIFPTTYFYTPKKLPKVFLGLGCEPLELIGRSLKLDPLELDLILKILHEAPQVKLIDLSKLHASSLGEQEVVLSFEDQKKRVVRLPVKGWQTALEKFQTIPPVYQEVDLRYANMALMR